MMPRETLELDGRRLDMIISQRVQALFILILPLLCRRSSRLDLVRGAALPVPGSDRPTLRQTSHGPPQYLTGDW